MNTPAPGVGEAAQEAQQTDAVGQLTVVKTLDNTHVLRCIGCLQVDGREDVPEHRSVDALPCIDGGIKQLMHDERLDALRIDDGDVARKETTAHVHGDVEVSLSDAECRVQSRRTADSDTGLSPQGVGGHEERRERVEWRHPHAGVSITRE